MMTSLQAALDRAPAKISPSASLSEAIELLVKLPNSASSSANLLEKANCLLVVENDRLLGLLSAKELVAAIAEEANLQQLQVSDLLKKDAIAVPSSELRDVNFVVRLFQHYHLQHLAVIDRDTNEIGLLSAFALCQTIQPKNLLSWKTAAEVMTTQIIRSDANANLVSLAKLMVSQGSDYLVSNDSQTILTERDLIYNYFLEQDLYVLPRLSKPNPLACLHPEDSLWTVHHKMGLYHKHSLAVIERKNSDANLPAELLGVVDRASLLSVLEPQTLYQTLQAIQLFPKQFSQLQRQKIEFLERRNLEIEAQAQEYIAQWEQGAGSREQGTGSREQGAEEQRSRDAEEKGVGVMPRCSPPETNEQNVGVMPRCSPPETDEWRVLKDSHDRLQDILNNPSVVISSFRLFADSTIEQKYFSVAAKQVYGYTPVELMGDKYLWFSRILPEDREKVILPALEQICTQETVAIEYRFLHQDGSVRWIANTMTSRRDETANCWIVTSSAIDISKRKQAEVSLQENNVLLNAIFERSAVGIVLADFKGRLLKTNLTFQQILGYEEKELQQIYFHELTYEEDRARDDALFAKLIEGQIDCFEIEKRYYRKNGEIIWVRNHVSQIGEPNARMAIAFVENITERKQAELALQKINEKLELRVQERTQELTQSQAALQNQTNLLQTILDSMGDGLLVADTEGQFLIFNPSAERILRMASIDFAALNGSTADDMYMSDRITPYPAEQLPIHRAIQGEPIDDAEIFIPNSETFEGIWLSITSRPIKDRIGKILGGVLTFRNTTERNLMEQALRQRETEFRTLVENSPDIIARLDSQLRHLYINPAVEKVLGVSRGSIIGKTYRELDLREDLLALMEESGKSVFATAQEEIVEFSLTTPKGERYYRMRIVPELAADGTVSSILTISPDITTIKQAEMQIKASLKEKEVLLKEIHHRVKNNLYVVASLLELQADSFNDPQINRLFEDSQNRIYSMALIHEKLYRSENLAQINFGDYLEDLVANLFVSYNLQEKSIELNIVAEPIFLNIETATPCGLIINELVSNTIKHAFCDNREGFLKVEFYRDRDNYLNLIVSDNGVGFPEHIDFQNTNSMGFQVICTLTEQLEGTIELDRSNGTSFLLRFQELHYSKRF
jgi:PAS domain S-box-containing protein